MSSKTSRICTYFDHGSDGTVLGGICGYKTAVDAGCTALWAGDVDTAIAGGANIFTDLDNHADLCNNSFPSTTGQCKVWDRDVNGYCCAEGIGAVVIKRLEDAEADNDNILAVVLSAASDHSGDVRSITRPHAGAQEANYRQGMEFFLLSGKPTIIYIVSQSSVEPVFIRSTYLSLRCTV
jgi:3-oxoacyl-(acyl-carrier-protein) synthase